MNKLWTFGCSTIAGCELGSNLSQQDISRWWKTNTKYNNREDFEQDTKFNYLQEDQLFEKWWAYIKKSESPQLSYGGQLAKNLNKQLVSKAVSGCGMDRVFYQLAKFKDNIDWERDLVIVELPPVYRYMTNEMIENKNQQLALINSIEAGRVAVSLTTLEYLYSGILENIKVNFPSVKIVDSGQVMETVKYKHYTINGDIKMNELANQNINNLEHVSYPGGHFVEDIHKQFADKLTDLFL
jgi:hypothetical protein